MSKGFRWAAALLAPVMTMSGGCGSPGVAETGVRIGDTTLEQFQAGATTEAWLVAVLGEPTTWAPVEGVPNTKVFRYASAEESGGVLATLMGRSRRNTAVAYFVITDGVVTRFWADRAQQRTLLGEPVDREQGAKVPQ